MNRIKQLRKAKGTTEPAEGALGSAAAAKGGGLDVSHGGGAPVGAETDITHGGGADGAKDEVDVTHGGGEDQSASPSKQASTATAESRDSSVGPAFPSLGVTLDFLERFVREKVAGKPSRYCTAKRDVAASAGDELSFKAGEILGIADLEAINDGWFVGYRRAGDWGERKKFRPEHVDRLAGLSTDEVSPSQAFGSSALASDHAALPQVCGDIIKPETSSFGWDADIVERSYARMVRAQGGGAGVGEATVFASHAWTFVFEELIESLRFFENQQLAAGKPPSYFWLDIFVVDENAAHTYPSEWWQTSFTQAVGAIGHTALVLTPWRSPVPLRRAWCLWEIYSTLGEKAKLSVCMSETENADFHRALVEDFESVLTSLSAIDAETAEVSAATVGLGCHHSVDLVG